MTHKLKASRPSEVEAYCNNLTDLLTKAGIFEKIEELYTGLYEASSVDQAYRIKKIKIYNSVTRDLMIAAENKLGPRAPMISHWSPTLKFKGQELGYYNECIKEDEEKGDLGASVHIPKAVTRNEFITCRSDHESKRLEVKLSWNQVTNNKAKIRKDFLREQATHATQTRNIGYESALKQIINAETSRALHARQGAEYGDGLLAIGDTDFRNTIGVFFIEEDDPF